YYGAGSDVVNNTRSGTFAQASFRAAFTLWFSSYVGDYGLEDNFMKAALGSGAVLTAGWAGAPHWHLHSMAMGFPISHGLVVTQNNDTLYTADFFPRGTHVNLLGDPTLKSVITAPPKDLNLTQQGNAVRLTWTLPETTTDRTYIYRRLPESTSFQLLDSTNANITDFTDQTASTGNDYEYLVRTAQLTTTPSGSFWNLSVGAKATIRLTTSSDLSASRARFTMYPNPTSGTVNITSPSVIQRVIVFSATGQQVYARFVNARQVRLALSTLPPGNYSLRVTTAERTFSRMISIIK
ncbi:MAG: T9SS type A sorting domain-containing protein, partial [Bacteroidota bacterium]